VVAVLVAAAMAGCGSDDGAGDDQTRIATPTDRSSREATFPERSRSEPSPEVERAECPPAQSNCRAASGRIVYVEAVDPDGDGDAHFVLASGDSVSGPGISVIDVKKELRPDPLPGIGDEISAAGPVFTGSYGQRQIEAVELHIAPDRD